MYVMLVPFLMLWLLVGLKGVVAANVWGTAKSNANPLTGKSSTNLFASVWQ